MSIFHHGSCQIIIILLFVLMTSSDGLDNPWSGQDDAESYFTNEFAVRIEGGIDVARGVALQHGYKLKTQIGSLTDYYLLHHKETLVRSRRETDQRYTKKLADDHRVLWFQQQQAKVRTKRGFVKPVLSSINFNDPLYTQQWYLNGATDIQRTIQPDMHVNPVWKQGITGEGVVVSIVDDGLETNHTDIFKNYDPSASWNFKENRNNPTPPEANYDHNGHGTRCAGEVAMVADNGKCGVGIAFDAKIGGIRMLEGQITDALEGASLSYNQDYIDIYSASWGPTDDGVTTSKPGTLAQKALEEGIKRGRNGKGALYAWASGNGGSKDNCNCDAYSSSIYTIATASVSETGQKTYYGETCSSVLTTSYSSGNEQTRSIISSDLHDQCTSAHGGTSAAAPMTAGVLALLLQANQDLTWRDVQHIIVQTSNRKLLQEDDGVEWRHNAAGHPFSDYFGFGLLDAEAMVKLAIPETWARVPEKSICMVEAGPSYQARKITHDQPIEMDITTDGCNGTTDDVKYLEHVVLTVTIDYSERGALNILLTSPSGTETKLLSERREDDSTEGMSDFPLMSVQLWGEQAATDQGVWKLHIFDSRSNVANTGNLQDWKLELHGTKELPKYMEDPSDTGM